MTTSDAIGQVKAGDIDDFAKRVSALESHRIDSQLYLARLDRHISALEEELARLKARAEATEALLGECAETLDRAIDTVESHAAQVKSRVSWELSEQIRALLSRLRVATQ